MRFSSYTPTVHYHEHEMTDGIAGEFLRNIDPKLDVVTDCLEYVIEDVSLVEFAEVIAKMVGGTITGYAPSILAVTKMNDFPMLVLLVNNDKTDGRTTEAYRSCIMVYATGVHENVKQLLSELEIQFPRKKYATLNWWYIAKGGTDHLSLVLDDEIRIYDEFYPWLDKGQAKYFDDFLKSSAPLLFISGEPGTGKTSFIRSNITRHNMGTYIGYDPKLFDSDDMFISFISSKRDNMMVIEDAESVVLPRDKTGNSMMSRFLNVSDGLLKNNKKKFIFTTNESNFEKIDDALIRPGRCFDFKQFRKLTFPEAKAAAKRAKLEIPTADKEYSLAELFNPTQHVKKQKVGFVA